MDFTLIILAIILIIAIIILSFIFINKLNKRRISQNCSKDDKTESVNNINDVYPSFSDQIHNPINLDRSLLEIEEISKRQLIKEDEEHFDDNSQNQLIRNSEFIF